LLSQDKFLGLLFYLLILFLPTQFGKHFWPNFSLVSGLRLDYLSPTLYFTDLIIFSIILISSNRILIFLQKLSTKNKLLISITYIFLIIGILLSYSPLAGFYGLLKITEYLLLFIFICTSKKYLSKKYLFYSLSFSVLIQSLLSILQVIKGGSLAGPLYFLGERMFTSSTPGIANASINGELILRPYATLPHPNVLAGFLIIYMLLILQNFEKKQLIFFLTTVCIFAISLVLTLSRIAILFFLISFILLFGISIYKKYKNAKLNINGKYILFVLIFALMVLIFYGQNVYGRFLSTNLFEQSFVQRQILITKSFEMFFSNPLFGVGLNNYYFHLSDKSFIQPVHNIFLLALSEGGIFVASIFIYILIKAIQKTIREKQTFLIISLLSVLALGSFDHYFLTLQQGQLLLVVLLGFTFSKTTSKE
jgi:hypothetical protein